MCQYKGKGESPFAFDWVWAQLMRTRIRLVHTNGSHKGNMESVCDKLYQTVAFKVWFVYFHRRCRHFSWHAALCSIDRDYTNPMITPASKRSFFMGPFSNLRVNEGELIWQDWTPPSPPPPQTPAPPHRCARLTCTDRTKARQVLHLKPRQAPFSSH